MCLKVFEWETIIIGNKCNGKDCKKLLEHVRKYSILSIRLTPMKMRFSLPEKGKLTLCKMATQLNPHTKLSLYKIVRVWAAILTPDRLLCLVVFLFGRLVFRSRVLR